MTGNVLPSVSPGESGLHTVDSYSTLLERHRDTLGCFLFKETKIYNGVESN